jgi:PAS domain S-box-containing protein
VEGRRFGTLNFSSPAVRQTPFTKAEKEFLLLMGQWVSTQLAQQKAADNLHHSEEQQRATLAAIPDMMFRLDKAGRFLDYHAPDQYKLMLNPADFIGRHLTEVLPTAVAEQLAQALQHVSTTDHSTQFEYQLHLPTGLSEFEGRVVAINDAEALALVRDITASKEAERTRLRLLEELTQLTTQQKIILDNAPAAIFMQKERTIIWGNRATEQVLGYTAEEMRHLPNVTYHVSPEAYAEFGARVLPPQERGEISHTEIQIRRKDGAVRWVYVTGQAINPQRVREDGVLWIMQDVTELKEAQLALQQTADRLAEAQALGRMSNWELDMVTGEVLWAKEHYTLFGVSPDTFAPTPLNFRACIHPDDIDIIDQSRTDVQAGKPYNLEYRVIRPDDGRVRHMHSWAKRLTNDQGELIRLVGVVQDVTERKEIEATIRAYAADLAIARDQALAASKYKSLLLSKVSHELRTPLGGILGYAELLRDGLVGQLQPEQHRFVMQIVRSSQHLNGLIADLLDQAQIEQGSLKVIQEPFFLAPMANFLEGLLQPMAAEKRLAFALHIAPTLPEMMLGDERRLRQIIINLTNNAIKFTETGGVQVSFQPADEQGWIIQVQDTGQGIPPESQSKIFDSFWQEDGSAVSAQKGYGLGLSIVHHLVQLMEGRIEIQSELGRGSTFTVWLPFKAF